MFESSPPVITQIVKIPGKGNGVIATKDIRKGALIISEAPIMTVSTSSAARFLLPNIVASLTADAQEVFMSLPILDEEMPLLSRLRHFLPMVGERLGPGGLFPTICRVNHSCAPNSIYFWIKELEKEGVYFLR